MVSSRLQETSSAVDFPCFIKNAVSGAKGGVETFQFVWQSSVFENSVKSISTLAPFFPKPSFRIAQIDRRLHTSPLHRHHLLTVSPLHSMNNQHPLNPQQMQMMQQLNPQQMQMVQQQQGGQPMQQPTTMIPQQQTSQMQQQQPGNVSSAFAPILIRRWCPFCWMG